MRLLRGGWRSNNGLTVLDLGFRGITSVGGLAQTLKKKNTLTKLRLWGNEIGKDGAEAIFEALKTNTSLIAIDLTDTNIDEAILNEIYKLLERNKALAKVGVSATIVTYQKDTNNPETSDDSDAEVDLFLDVEMSKKLKEPRP